MISSFRQNLAIPSWSNVATCIASCLKILKYSVWPTKYMKNMARKTIHDLLFSCMVKYNPCVSCGINNVTGINDFVEPCSVKMITTSGFRDICINTPPLPTDVFDAINTPISCINTTDIDYIEGSSSYNLKDVAKCSTIPCENVSLCVILGDESLNNTHISKGSPDTLPIGSTFYYKQTHPSFWDL